MSKRYKPNQRQMKRKFVATAVKTHPKNVAPSPMRGGYRI